MVLRQVLGLDLCWEEELLRFYDPATGRYLRTFYDADNDRISAENERDVAKGERDATQDERDTERTARLAAEERIRDLEADIRRLRG